MTDGRRSRQLRLVKVGWWKPRKVRQRFGVVLALSAVMVASTIYVALASHQFSDVPTSPAVFHDAVEWIVNRAITAGCTPGLYCPNDAVTRLQMALFMTKLGKALTPTFRVGSGFTATPTIAGCPTMAYTPTFPQTANIHARVSTTSMGAHEHHSLTKVSTDGGATWSPTDTFPFSIDSAVAGAFAQTSYFSTFDVSPGTSYRFAVEIGIFGSGVSAGCHVQVAFVNRNPTTSPLRPAPPITEEQKRRP